MAQAKTQTDAQTELRNALGVIVRDPTLGRELRRLDPKAFAQAVTAFWNNPPVPKGFTAKDVTPVYTQDGNRCHGCGGELKPFLPILAGLNTLPILRRCAGCGGIGNTGFGDHMDAIEYGHLFAGFEAEPTGTKLIYFDITTVACDGAVDRRHGWFWTDKAGQRWIAQTG